MKKIGKKNMLTRAPHGEQQRILLDAAGRLLQAQGTEGFSVRKLAQMVGASTIAVYTLFGSKDLLLHALYSEGLARLGEALATVTADAPVAYLMRLACAYRQFALDHPQYYHAMTAAAGPRARATRRIRSSRAFQLLLDGVTRCVNDGIFAGQDPSTVADALWGLVHGMVSLDLAGYFPSAVTARERFAAAGQALLHGFTVSPERKPARRTAERASGS